MNLPIPPFRFFQWIPIPEKTSHDYMVLLPGFWLNHDRTQIAYLRPIENKEPKVLEAIEVLRGYVAYCQQVSFHQHRLGNIVSHVEHESSARAYQVAINIIEGALK